MNYRKWFVVACIALGVALAADCARATIFTFDDEYYISSSSMFTSRFGSPGTGSYSSAGIYQLTKSTSPTVVTRLGSATSIPGEYVQNTATNATQFLSLTGWGQSLNNGNQVGSVYNLTNPANGTVLYFQYRVGTTSGSGAGGTLTPFTFNSFDLRGSTPTANLSFTLQGYLNNVLVNSAILNVTGNTFSTFTENWQNVDTIEIVSTGTLPVNWGSGTLYMDNVSLSTPGSTDATPEPATFIIWSVLGGIGLVIGWRRKRNVA